MKSFLDHNINYICLFFVVCSPALFIACSTANRTAYVASAGTHTSVKVAMALWDQTIKSGKSTLAQEQAVKSAFEKVRVTMIALTDSGAVLSAASQTNNTAAAFSQGLSQAAAEATQAQADLIALLKSYGIAVN